MGFRPVSAGSAARSPAAWQDERQGCVCRVRWGGEMPYHRSHHRPLRKKRLVADENECNAVADGKGVRLGSLFGPSYIESYAEAWKTLLPNTRKLALPVFYLQRHTFELLVKELLLGALQTRSELHALDDLFGTAESAGPAEPDDYEKAHTTHSFSELFPCLERSLTALRRPSLPEAFAAARRLFTEVDEDRPDRLRYETVFNRKQRMAQPSFPNELAGKRQKLAPCDQVGSLLKEILLARQASLSPFSHHATPPTTELAKFYTAAWESSQESEAEVLHRLGSLTAATRDGCVKWAVSSGGLNIQEHPDLKSITSAVFDGHLEARFRDRLLTIVMLKNSTGEVSDSFLAARRPNGTLTSGIWISNYELDLISEIREALNRAGNTSAT